MFTRVDNLKVHLCLNYDAKDIGGWLMIDP